MYLIYFTTDIQTCVTHIQDVADKYGHVKLTNLKYILYKTEVNILRNHLELNDTVSTNFIIIKWLQRTLMRLVT